jgi:hypothetical protein
MCHPTDVRQATKHKALHQSISILVPSKNSTRSTAEQPRRCNSTNSKASHWTHSLANSICLRPSQLRFLKSITFVSFHPPLSRPCGSFPTKFYINFLSLIISICTAHRGIVDFTILPITGESHESRNPSTRNAQVSHLL